MPSLLSGAPRINSLPFIIIPINQSEILLVYFLIDFLIHKVIDLLPIIISRIVFLHSLDLSLFNLFVLFDIIMNVIFHCYNVSCVTLYDYLFIYIYTLMEPSLSRCLFFYLIFIGCECLRTFLLFLRDTFVVANLWIAAISSEF